MRAGVGPNCRLPVIQPPCWVCTLVALLLRISPFALTLNWSYWLRDTPAALGGAICTIGTPFCAASMIGRCPAGALALGVVGADCAYAGRVVSALWQNRTVSMTLATLRTQGRAPR